MKKKITLKVEEIEFSIFGNKAEFIVFSIENMEDLCLEPIYLSSRAS